MLARHWILLSLALPSRLPGQDLFEFRRVAPDVFMAIPRPERWTNSNAGVIILDDGVLIVDSHGSPRAAQALIRQLRQMTKKPVRYVVNTHFHPDHVYGNQAYTAAWPAGVEIISSELTRQHLERLGAQWLREELDSLPGTIAHLRDSLARANDPTIRDTLAQQFRDTEARLRDVRALHLTLPTVTFDRSLIIRRGQRAVQLLYLGRGHTEGDVVVYLPRERVVVTGDLLTGWAPYMGDSYPYDWIQTLRHLEALDFEFVIGGHGDLLTGKGPCQLWADYLTDLMQETERASASEATLDQVKARVIPILKDRFASRFSPKLMSRIEGNVEKAFEVVHASR
jgi:cyclase